MGSASGAHVLLHLLRCWLFLAEPVSNQRFLSSTGGLNRDTGWRASHSCTEAAAMAPKQAVGEKKKTAKKKAVKKPAATGAAAGAGKKPKAQQHVEGAGRPTKRPRVETPVPVEDEEAEEEDDEMVRPGLPSTMLAASEQRGNCCYVMGGALVALAAAARANAAAPCPTRMMPRLAARSRACVFVCAVFTKRQPCKQVFLRV